MIFQSFSHVLSKCYPNLSLRTSDPMAQAHEILKRVGLEREPFTPKVANIYSWHKPDFHNFIQFLVLTKPLRISGVTWCHTKPTSASSPLRPMDFTAAPCKRQGNRQVVHPLPPWTLERLHPGKVSRHTSAEGREAVNTHDMWWLKWQVLISYRVSMELSCSLWV